MKIAPEHPAPKHLDADSRRLWREIVDDYDLDAAGLAVLQSALESRDRATRAKALVELHGELLTDKYGQLKTNPATTVERDARRGFLQGLKQLNLDVPPTREAIGRPPESERT